ncbi:MAG: hydantoinase/oxoprolinase family protein, partial [Actinobacteria bacterium]|nr:hydantoinase/oxoprolinase family protein [Actinomycetota bacterium]
GTADLRYRGQGFELSVPLGGDIAATFHRAHEDRYGYSEPDRELELVAVRTADITPGPALDLRGGEQRIVAGPAVVELSGATCWVPGGWRGATDPHGTLVLERR